MTITRAALVALALLDTPGAVQRPSWHGLEAGPHATGLRRLSAPATGAVWYPADGTGKALTLGDYYGQESAEGFGRFLAGAGVSRSEIDRMLALPMAARMEARAKPGRFPIVAIAQGNAHDIPDQAVLAEYLSSHGYIVVTTPSPMLSERMTAEDQIARFAEKQADDLVAALDAVGRTMKSADATRMAVVGHSFGARSALLLAMRDARVRALVSLDGGIGTAVGIDVLRTAPSFAIDRARVPILHLHQRIDPQVVPDFAFLRTLPASVEIREIDGMKHPHFSTLGFIAADVSEIAKLSGAGPQIAQSVATAARATKAFIDRHIDVERR